MAERLFEAGIAALEGGDVDRAIEILRRVVASNPDDSDARHALALAHEARGEIDAMKREFMQVRLLDAEADRHFGVGSPHDLRFVESVAADVIANLPAQFRDRMTHVPLMLEKRPSLALVRSGVDPRSLGLFEGPSILDGEVEAPARVVVFTHNLLAAHSDPDELAEQIEITLLHEIGHYFGLEEEDMARLGLE